MEKTNEFDKNYDEIVKNFSEVAASSVAGLLDRMHEHLLMPDGFLFICIGQSEKASIASYRPIGNIDFANIFKTLVKITTALGNEAIEQGYSPQLIQEAIIKCIRENGGDVVFSNGICGNA